MAPGPAPLPAATVPLGNGVGRVVTDQELLLTFDPASATWRRLPGKAVLSAGQRVLSLPAFRPVVGLSNGITVQAAGPSLFDLQEVDAQGLPELFVEYGRLAMFGSGIVGLAGLLRRKLNA